MNTDTVMNNTTEAIIPSVAVKVTRGDEMRRFNFQGKSFQELKNTIAQLFGIPATDFTLQYQDDEKDRVTLSSDAELKEAVQLHKYVLRFFVNGPKPAAAAVGDLSSGFPAPHYHHHRHHHGHHHHGVASPPPPHVMAVSAEGEVSAPPPCGPHGHGRHGRHGHGPHGHGPHGHGPHGRPFGGPHGPYKRCLDKEDKEAMKCERKRWKKQRKCESSSSSSSSSEDEAQKLQKKEMKQLMRATKMSIKANWAPTKQANPAQWPENRKLMIQEIKLAKRLIREQASKSTTPTVAVTEQNAPVVTAGAEMQA